MPRYFAFLRAINVGGHNVKMEELRVLFESLKFKNVETFIASGNVIFESKSGDETALTTKIEKKLRAQLGYEVTTFLRTDKELIEIARYKPFSDSEIATAWNVYIGFVDEPVSVEVRKTLMEFRSEVDDFHTHSREVYWLARVKQVDSAFSNAVFEKILKGRSTWRGMNTIARLATRYLAS